MVNVTSIEPLNMNLENKDFRSWIRSCDKEKRKDILGEFYKSLERAGFLTKAEKNKAVIQLTSLTTVNVEKLPDDRSMWPVARHPERRAWRNSWRDDNTDAYSHPHLEEENGTRSVRRRIGSGDKLGTWAKFKKLREARKGRRGVQNGSDRTNEMGNRSMYSEWRGSERNDTSFGLDDRGEQHFRSFNNISCSSEQSYRYDNKFTNGREPKSSRVSFDGEGDQKFRKFDDSRERDQYFGRYHDLGKINEPGYGRFGHIYRTGSKPNCGKFDHDIKTKSERKSRKFHDRFDNERSKCGAVHDRGDWNRLKKTDRISDRDDSESLSTPKNSGNRHSASSRNAEPVRKHSLHAVAEKSSAREKTSGSNRKSHKSRNSDEGKKEMVCDIKSDCESNSSDKVRYEVDGFDSVVSKTSRPTDKHSKSTFNRDNKPITTPVVNESPKDSCSILVDETKIARCKDEESTCTAGVGGNPNGGRTCTAEVGGNPDFSLQSNNMVQNGTNRLSVVITSKDRNSKISVHCSDRHDEVPVENVEGKTVFNLPGITSSAQKVQHLMTFEKITSKCSGLQEKICERESKQPDVKGIAKFKDLEAKASQVVIESHDIRKKDTITSEPNDCSGNAEVPPQCELLIDVGKDDELCGRVCDDGIHTSKLESNDSNIDSSTVKSEPNELKVDISTVQPIDDLNRIKCKSSHLQVNIRIGESEVQCRKLKSEYDLQPEKLSLESLNANLEKDTLKSYCEPHSAIDSLHQENGFNSMDDATIVEKGSDAVDEEFGESKPNILPSSCDTWMENKAPELHSEELGLEKTRSVSVNKKANLTTINSVVSIQTEPNEKKLCEQTLDQDSTKSDVLSVDGGLKPSKTNFDNVKRERATSKSGISVHQETKGLLDNRANQEEPKLASEKSNQRHHGTVQSNSCLEQLEFEMVSTKPKSSVEIKLPVPKEKMKHMKQGEAISELAVVDPELVSSSVRLKQGDLKPECGDSKQSETKLCSEINLETVKTSACIRPNDPKSNNIDCKEVELNSEKLEMEEAKSDPCMKRKASEFLSMLPNSKEERSCDVKRKYKPTNMEHLEAGSSGETTIPSKCQLEKGRGEPESITSNQSKKKSKRGNVEDVEAKSVGTEPKRMVTDSTGTIPEVQKVVSSGSVFKKAEDISDCISPKKCRMKLKSEGNSFSSFSHSPQKKCCKTKKHKTLRRKVGFTIAKRKAVAVQVEAKDKEKGINGKEQESSKTTCNEPHEKTTSKLGNDKFKSPNVVFPSSGSVEVQMEYLKGELGSHVSECMINKDSDPQVKDQSEIENDCVLIGESKLNVNGTVISQLDAKFAASAILPNRICDTKIKEDPSLEKEKLVDSYDKGIKVDLCNSESICSNNVRADANSKSDCDEDVNKRSLQEGILSDDGQSCRKSVDDKLLVERNKRKKYRAVKIPQTVCKKFCLNPVASAADNQNSVDLTIPEFQNTAESLEMKLSKRYEELFGKEHGGINDSSTFDFEKLTRNIPVPDSGDGSDVEKKSVDSMPWVLKKIEVDISTQLRVANRMRRKNDMLSVQNDTVQKCAKVTSSLGDNESRADPDLENVTAVCSGRENFSKEQKVSSNDTPMCTGSVGQQGTLGSNSHLADNLELIESLYSGSDSDGILTLYAADDAGEDVKRSQTEHSRDLSLPHLTVEISAEKLSTDDKHGKDEVQSNTFTVQSNASPDVMPNMVDDGLENHPDISNEGSLSTVGLEPKKISVAVPQKRSLSSVDVEHKRIPEVVPRKRSLSTYQVEHRSLPEIMSKEEHQSAVKMRHNLPEILTRKQSLKTGDVGKKILPGIVSNKHSSSTSQELPLKITFSPGSAVTKSQKHDYVQFKVQSSNSLTLSLAANKVSNCNSSSSTGTSPVLNSETTGTPTSKSVVQALPNLSYILTSSDNLNTSSENSVSLVHPSNDSESLLPTIATTTTTVTNGAITIKQSVHTNSSKAAVGSGSSNYISSDCSGTSSSIVSTTASVININGEPELRRELGVEVTDLSNGNYKNGSSKLSSSSKKIKENLASGMGKAIEGGRSMCSDYFDGDNLKEGSGICNILPPASTAEPSEVNAEDNGVSYGNKIQSGANDRASCLRILLKTKSLDSADILPVNSATHSSSVDVPNKPDNLSAENICESDVISSNNSIVGAIRVRKPESLGVSSEYSKQFLEQQQQQQNQQQPPPPPPPLEPLERGGNVADLLCGDDRVLDSVQSKTAGTQSVESNNELRTLLTNIPDNLKGPLKLFANSLACIFRDVHVLDKKMGGRNTSVDSGACCEVAMNLGIESGVEHECTRERELIVLRNSLIQMVAIRYRTFYKYIPIVSSYFKNYTCAALSATADGQRYSAQNFELVLMWINNLAKRFPSLFTPQAVTQNDKHLATPNKSCGSDVESRFNNSTSRPGNHSGGIGSAGQTAALTGSGQLCTEVQTTNMIQNFPNREASLSQTNAPSLQHTRVVSSSVPQHFNSGLGMRRGPPNVTISPQLTADRTQASVPPPLPLRAQLRMVARRSNLPPNLQAVRFQGTGTYYPQNVVVNASPQQQDLVRPRESSVCLDQNALWERNSVAQQSMYSQPTVSRTALPNHSTYNQYQTNNSAVVQPQWNPSFNRNYGYSVQGTGNQPPVANVGTYVCAGGSSKLPATGLGNPVSDNSQHPYSAPYYGFSQNSSQYRSQPPPPAYRNRPPSPALGSANLNRSAQGQNVAFQRGIETNQVTHGGQNERQMPQYNLNISYVPNAAGFNSWEPIRGVNNRSSQKGSLVYSSSFNQDHQGYQEMNLAQHASGREQSVQGRNGTLFQTSVAMEGINYGAEKEMQPTRNNQNNNSVPNASAFISHQQINISNNRRSSQEMQPPQNNQIISSVPNETSSSAHQQINVLNNRRPRQNRRPSQEVQPSQNNQNISVPNASVLSPHQQINGSNNRRPSQQMHPPQNYQNLSRVANAPALNSQQQINGSNNRRPSQEVQPLQKNQTISSAPNATSSSSYQQVNGSNNRRPSQEMQPPQNISSVSNATAFNSHQQINGSNNQRPSQVGGLVSDPLSSLLHHRLSVSQHAERYEQQSHQNTNSQTLASNPVVNRKKSEKVRKIDADKCESQDKNTNASNTAAPVHTKNISTYSAKHRQVLPSLSNSQDINMSTVPSFSQEADNETSLKFPSTTRTSVADAASLERQTGWLKALQNHLFPETLQSLMSSKETTSERHHPPSVPGRRTSSSERHNPPSVPGRRMSSSEVEQNLLSISESSELSGTSLLVNPTVSNVPTQTSSSEAQPQSVLNQVKLSNMQQNMLSPYQNMSSFSRHSSNTARSSSILDKEQNQRSAESRQIKQLDNSRRRSTETQPSGRQLNVAEIEQNRPQFISGQSNTSGGQQLVVMSTDSRRHSVLKAHHLPTAGVQQNRSLQPMIRLPDMQQNLPSNMARANLSEVQSGFSLTSGGKSSSGSGHLPTQPSIQQASLPSTLRQSFSSESQKHPPQKAGGIISLQMEQNLSSHSMPQQTGQLDAEHNMSSHPILQPDISSGMQETCSSNQISLKGVQDNTAFHRRSTSLEGEHNNVLTSGRNSLSKTNLQNFPPQLALYPTNSSDNQQHVPPNNSLKTQPDLSLASGRVNSITEQNNSSHFIPSLSDMEQNHSLSSGKRSSLSRVEKSSHVWEPSDLSEEKTASRQNDLLETEQKISPPSLSTQMCISVTSKYSPAQVPLSRVVQDGACEQNSTSSASPSSSRLTKDTSQSDVLQSSIQESSSEVSNRLGQQQVPFEENLTSSVDLEENTLSPEVRILVSPEVAVLEPEENWPDVELLYEVVAPCRTISRDSGYTTPSPMVVAGDVDNNQTEGDGDNVDEIILCAVCNRLAEVICSGCRLKCYCSEMCQLSHWNLVHHLECTIQQDDD